jgi:hypothetical protein
VLEARTASAAAVSAVAVDAGAIRTPIMSGPSATVIVVEDRDRLARVEHRHAALPAQGRRVIVVDAGADEHGEIGPVFASA